MEPDLLVRVRPWGGRAGGAMGVRAVPVEARLPRVPAAPPLAVAPDGVPVRDVSVEDAEGLSTLVGDLAMLDGLDVLTGLGLGALRLIRLPAFGSLTVVLDRLPTGGGSGGLVLTVGLGGGASTVRAAGRRNMPLPCSVSKYRTPATDPSFFPS